MNLPWNVHSLETTAYLGRGWGGPLRGFPQVPLRVWPQRIQSPGNPARGATTPRACMTPDPGGEFCFSNGPLKFATESLDWIVFPSPSPPRVFSLEHRLSNQRKNNNNNNNDEKSSEQQTPKSAHDSAVHASTSAGGLDIPTKHPRQSWRRHGRRRIRPQG